MSKVLERAVRLMLALVVAGGLGFGASTAVAASQSASSCPNNPDTGQIPISCTANTDCDEPCRNYFGPAAGGGCLSGCCVCAI